MVRVVSIHFHFGGIHMCQYATVPQELRERERMMAIEIEEKEAAWDIDALVWDWSRAVRLRKEKQEKVEK